MKVIVKPSENTLTQIEVTTSETREKELLELGEEVYKFLNPDNRVIISSKGKVLVKENKGFYRLVKTHKDLNGYDLVTLQNRTYLVHSLVAQTFLDTPSGLLSTIKHINGDKSDNSVANLRWVTHSENMSNSSKHKRRSSWENIVAEDLTTGEIYEFSRSRDIVPFSLSRGWGRGWSTAIHRKLEQGGGTAYQLYWSIKTKETKNIG